MRQNRAGNICGRFIIADPDEALARLFAASTGNDLPPVPRFYICPTQSVAVVTGGAARRLRAIRWGFLPVWYKSAAAGRLIINARADTIAIKPAFWSAVREQRCLIPASGFYEWSAGPAGERLPWYIPRTDGAAMAFAGIWQRRDREGQAIDTCAIVTTDAGPDMAAIHHRARSFSLRTPGRFGWAKPATARHR